MRTTPVAEVLDIRRGRRLLGADPPPPSLFVNLELADDAYVGVPCWSGGGAYWAHVTVAAAYDLRYAEIRPQMTSGGIAKRTLVVIAAAFARTADADTGRNARPTNEQLADATGFTERTVQRARECLRLLAVATEVLRGRQRTYIERMASWRMGDRHRGWASVWALHDDAQVNRVIHTVSPHLERSPVTPHTSPQDRLVTTHGRHKGARHGVATRRPAPDPGGRRLATAWRNHPHAPPWARRFTPTSWAAMLAAPAAAGWTPRDLNQLITDWLGVGRRIPDSPARPIGLLGAILTWHGADNLGERPAALDEAREAQARAAQRIRIAENAASHRAHLAGRAAAQAATSGPGRAAAFAALAAARRRSAQRRTEQAAAEQTRIDALIDRARRDGSPAPDATRNDLWR
ncbi:helix-turn-helix domain-containing protein [Mycobacterium intracellulare subsp. chimaera]|uniref:Helix-turn-helix domain-containing protein n=1 Tax=Mycobacterium intracellulare subsp. chimaera TaxID=222805 RepID=A0ABT7P2X5_MYCIT|nr:helix-turn-helix domain-containing protein [Mycobacterium intracellulare]MDM3927428.1 helix-turn-helix domain-containing protein [Mycobacterium intracellulare subsp. chimaera]